MNASMESYPPNWIRVGSNGTPRTSSKTGALSAIALESNSGIPSHNPADPGKFPLGESFRNSSYRS